MLSLVVLASEPGPTPALALFDFAASEADELSLRRGDSLVVLAAPADDEGRGAFY